MDTSKMVFLVAVLLLTLFGATVGIEVSRRQSKIRQLGVWLVVVALWAATLTYFANVSGFLGSVEWMNYSSRLLGVLGLAMFFLLFGTPIFWSVQEIWASGGIGRSGAIGDMPRSLSETLEIVSIFIAVALGFWACLRLNFHPLWIVPFSIISFCVFLAVWKAFGALVCWFAAKFARKFSPHRKKLN